MKLRTPLLLCAAAAALSVGGCATQEYVDEQVAAVNGRLQDLSARTDSRFQETSSRLDAVDRNAQQAQQTADGAATLAKGKMVYSVLSEQDAVTFNTNQWKLSSEAEATLTAFADRLKSENKNVYVEIVGHGDPRGSVYNNRILGEKRALEVRRFLTSQGIPLTHMETVSWGEERQSGTGGEAQPNDQQRRVVLRVLG